MRPKDITANHSLQLKTSRGSGRFFNLKILTGFFEPPAMVKFLCSILEESKTTENEAHCQGVLRGSSYRKQTLPADNIAGYLRGSVAPQQRRLFQLPSGKGTVLRSVATTSKLFLRLTESDLFEGIMR
jgi:hypothetical protein